MKEGQEAIYVLTGDDADALAKSPQLEGFKARGIEVLLLTDPVDSFWPDRLHEWEGKPIRSVSKGAADLSKLAPESAPEGEGADLGKLIEAVKAALGEAVAEVRSTDRLVESAVVLTAAGFGPDLQMQRLLRRAGRAMLPTPPVLEINPKHALISALASRSSDASLIGSAAGTLLDLARVQEGDLPRDPAGFARRVTSLLGSSLAQS
jgi:molecular chaperone HtpG